MIRKAKPNDANEFINMAYVIHSECVYADLDFVAEKAYKAFFTWLEDSRYLVICDDDNNGVIKGFFVAELGLYSYGNDDDIIAKDLMLYIKPEYRDEDVAVRLISVYEKWTKEYNVKCMRLNHTCGINRGKVNRVFRGLNFKPCPRQFKKGI